SPHPTSYPPAKRRGTIDLDKISIKPPTNISIGLFVLLYTSNCLYVFSTNGARHWLLIPGVPVSIVTFGVLAGAGMLLNIWNRIELPSENRIMTSVKWPKVALFTLTYTAQLYFWFMGLAWLESSRILMITQYSEIWSISLITYILGKGSDLMESNNNPTTLSRKFAADFGGNRRLLAIAVPLGAVLISPLAFVQFLMLSRHYLNHIGSINAIALTFVGLGFGLIFWNFVVNYLVCSQISTIKRVSLGWPLSIISAVLSAHIWFHCDFSIVDILLCALFYFGIYTLIRSDPRYTNEVHFQSTGYNHSRFELLPLHGSKMSSTVSLKSSTLLANGLLESILNNDDSRQIFYFLILNLSYMFVQMIYGIWTNSLGLISDAIHMFFDCLALGVGLLAAIMSKWPTNNKFTYGYGRIETLSGFANGIFLVLISIFILFEALARLIDPPEMNTDRLLLVSFLGLIVNLVGIYLHILADTLGSVGVIISTILIEQFGWTGFDPLASILIAGLIFMSVIPLLKNSARVLMLTLTDNMERKVEEGLNEILHIPGVLSFTMHRFWPSNVNCLVGSVHIQTTDDVDASTITDEVTSLLKLHITDLNELTIQVEKINGFSSKCYCSTFLTNFNNNNIVKRKSS
ncbi:9379_t:CDS:10, partial [Ambispora gerdemannii]